MTDTRRKAPKKTNTDSIAAVVRILQRNGKSFAKNVLTYVASLEKAIAGGARRDR